MKFVFAMGHPAHYHLYKNTIRILSERGHTIKVVVSQKDILIDLIETSEFDYEVIASSKPNETLLQKGHKLFESSIKLYRICKEFKPNLLAGCLSQIGVIGRLLRIPTVFNAEDDIDYTLLQGLITYPFVSYILSPRPTNVGYFSYKKIPYEGYHKLAYLHPNQFAPDFNTVEKEIGADDFVLIRLVNLNAYHDINVKGITENILRRLIALLEKKYNVFITSEKPLSDEFKKFELHIKPEEIHHFLYFTSLFIGDSQSMAVESAVLGTPNLKFNDFAGRINVLNELEKEFKLTKGISANDANLLQDEACKMVNSEHLRADHQANRKKMLECKIDVTRFFVWFFENYPKSTFTIKANPDFQFKFR